jgi:hypothetical protein
VLDPSTQFEDLDETTGPVSWNGVSTGLGSSSARLIAAPPPVGRSAMERVTVASRRIVRDRKRLAPLAALSALGLVVGAWRALSPGSGAPMMSSQTFLTAPGRGSEPTVAEMFGASETAEAKAGDTSATAADVVARVPEAAATALAERRAPSSPRVAPRRPAPPARPKAALASGGSLANEPDVGF